MLVVYYEDAYTPREDGGFQREDFFGGDKLGGGCVLRKKLAKGSVWSQKYLRISSQITFKLNVYPRRFVIVPAEKREEVKILDDMIKRLKIE